MQKLGIKSFVKEHHLEQQTVAAGVSGGADSLALALGLQEAGCRVVALTVDHRLRKESAKEAEYVAKVMQAAGIEHHILRWDGSKPESSLEEAARKARYKLMFDFCRQHNIRFLATGHHRRDQAETFLLRLARGSGVFGLSGILPVSERNGIILIRPQLDTAPEDLRAYLRRKGICWVEDPMNDDADFLRVKIRKFLPRLAEIGIDEKRLAATAATLANTRNFIQDTIDEFAASQVRFWDGAAVSLSWRKFKELPAEIARPLLGQLIGKIGGSDYQPEAAELQRILAAGADFKGCTLGKCELFIAAKRLWIVPQDEGNRLMSKEEWAAFAARHPEYRNAGLPYKVRRALKEKLEG